MKKVIRLFICMVLCVSLSFSLLCPVSAEAPSVISPDVRAYMEQAEDSALIPVWVFQEGPTKDELYAFYLAEIPNGLHSEEHEAARRAIMRREYGAINTAFVEKYCDDHCNVLFQSQYSAMVIVEVPKETVLEIAEDPQVVSIELYTDEPEAPSENFPGELSPELTAEIKEAYFRLHEDLYEDYGDELSADDIRIYKYYGNYHGYEIVHMPELGLSVPASGTLELGGLKFSFPNITDISNFLAYRNGEFLEISLLYEDGLLIQEDVTNLWLTHQDIPLSEHPFEDVSVTEWYYKGLRYCYDRGIMMGVKEDRFAPDAPMTRAMLVTVLWRAAGEPEAASSTFTDVADGTWYSEAVGWAEDNGVVNGIGDGKFGPERNITREEIAAILHRCSDSPSPQGKLSFYLDHEDVSDFAAISMLWATRERIIDGIPADGGTKLAPQELATRAQVATMIMRYLEAQS